MMYFEVNSYPLSKKIAPINASRAFPNIDRFDDQIQGFFEVPSS